MTKEQTVKVCNPHPYPVVVAGVHDVAAGGVVDLPAYQAKSLLEQGWTRPSVDVVEVPAEEKE